MSIIKFSGNARFKFRFDTTENWEKAAPKLYAGEIGIEKLTDGSRRMKIGDGEHNWNELGYVTDSTYSPNSLNAQSGRAVSEAVASVAANRYTKDEINGMISAKQDKIGTTEINGTTGVTTFTTAVTDILDPTGKSGIEFTSIGPTLKNVNESAYRSDSIIPKGYIDKFIYSENQEKSNALKGKKSGAVIQLSGVSPVEHTLSVKLTGETVSDFSGVKVTKYGKNLLDIPESLAWSGIYTLNTYIPTGTYNLTRAGETHGGTDTPVMRIANKSYNLTRDWTITLTAPQTVIYIYSNGYNASASQGVSATVDKLMLSVDGGDYEEYKAPTEYTPDADGTVEGIKSVYPTTTLMTDTEGVTVNAEYNRDINKAFAELQQAIISLGGNV